MKLTTGLLHETAIFIEKYYHAEFSPDFSFHNYNRALNIVRNCGRLGEQMNIKKEDLEILLLAAWLLETGYCKDYFNYQSASVALANEYLSEKSVDEEIKRTIEEIILSTRIPQQPVTLMGQVICDASMYHLADKNYLQNIENLRLERETAGKMEYSDKDWLNENINTLNEHFYFTSAARALFGKKKRKRKALLQQQTDLQNYGKEQAKQSQLQDNSEKSLEPFLEDIKLERGVETFFRISERRHMELSSMAHDKASLLISINSIVVSIVLSVLITKLDENRYLLFPTLLLVITCVTTIVLAVISTIPKFIKKDPKSKYKHGNEVNILFFGDFSKLTLTDYKKAMKETYKDKNELYDSLSRDIYYQGIILVWKYKYIKVAYIIFMYGFIITILSFIAAFIIRTK
ncbi:MAG: Pycsar system effector family protein [Ferruginibacter sp.]